MPRRNKVVSFFAMQIAVFLWVIGWGPYSVGSKKIQPNQNPTFNSLKLNFVCATLEKNYALTPNEK